MTYDPCCELCHLAPKMDRCDCCEDCWYSGRYSVAVHERMTRYERLVDEASMRSLDRLFWADEAAA